MSTVVYKPTVYIDSAPAGNPGTEAFFSVSLTDLYSVPATGENPRWECGGPGFAFYPDASDWHTAKVVAGENEAHEGIGWVRFTADVNLDAGIEELAIEWPLVVRPRWAKFIDGNAVIV